LLDWSTAIDIFKRTGSSLLLADLLGRQHNELKFANGPQIVHALRQLSLSLDLIRSQGILIAAYKLVREIQVARNQRVTPQEEPIVRLVEQVANEFEQFAMKQPHKQIQEYLRKTLKLIDWYFKRNRYSDALLLANEWCVSWLMARDNKPVKDIFDREARKRYTQTIAGNRPEISHFWVDLKRLRNKLAHCETGEWTPEEPDAKKLEGRINAVLAQVIKLEQQL